MADNSHIVSDAALAALERGEPVRTHQVLVNKELMGGVSFYSIGFDSIDPWRDILVALRESGRIELYNGVLTSIERWCHRDD